MDKKNIRLILVQICEAHTVKWPLGFIDHPEQHKTFEERIDRANFFNDTYPYFEVYVDKFDNGFEQLYRAWPDKYVMIDENKKIIKKSEYGMDALVIEDYADVVKKLIKE